MHNLDKQKTAQIRNTLGVSERTDISVIKSTSKKTMTTREIIIALTIHLILPLTGLLYFFKINRQIHRENIVNAPTIELFIIFATYGGLLLLTLTTFFWQWSGLASLGTFYLILAAPIVMTIIAIRQRQTKLNSKYHNWAFKSALFYFVIAPVTLTILFLFSKN